MSSDSLSLLAQRLEALQTDGIKLNPATANPGERRAAAAARRRCRRSRLAAYSSRLGARP